MDSIEAAKQARCQMVLNVGWNKDGRGLGGRNPIGG